MSFMPYKLFTDLPACDSPEWRTKAGSLRNGILANYNDACLYWQKIRYDVVDGAASSGLLASFCPSHQSLLIWHLSICVDFKCILPFYSFYPLFHSLSTHVSLHLYMLYICLRSPLPGLLFHLSVLLLSILTPAIVSGRPPHNKTPGGSPSSRISQFLLSSHSSGAVYAKNSFIGD